MKKIINYLQSIPTDMPSSQWTIISVGIVISIIASNLFVALLINIFWPHENHQMVYTLATVTSFLVAFLVTYFITEHNFQYRAKIERLAHERADEILIISEELKKNQDCLRKLNETLEEKVIEELHKNASHEKYLLNQSLVVNIKELTEHIILEWKQPLCVITTISSSINYNVQNNNLNDLKTAYKDIETIISQAQLLSQKVNEFHSLICKEDQKNFFDINKEILELEKMLYKPLTQYNIRLELDLKATSSLQTFQKQLVQSIINIFYNSRDNFILNEIQPNDRIFSIETTNDENYCYIVIKDSSGHLDKLDLKNAFEPFPTTKKEHLALGLYISYNIITANLKGRMTIENSLIHQDNNFLKGIMYTITIPLEI